MLKKQEEILTYKTKVLRKIANYSFNHHDSGSATRLLKFVLTAYVWGKKSASSQSEKLHFSSTSALMHPLALTLHSANHQRGECGSAASMGSWSKDGSWRTLQCPAQQPLTLTLLTQPLWECSGVPKGTFPWRSGAVLWLVLSSPCTSLRTLELLLRVGQVLPLTQFGNKPSRL